MGNTITVPKQGIFETFDFESAQSSLPDRTPQTVSALAIGLAANVSMSGLLPLVSIQPQINACALAQETLCRVYLAQTPEQGVVSLDGLLQLVDRPFPCLSLLCPKLGEALNGFLERCQAWLASGHEETAIELMQSAILVSSIAPGGLNPLLPQQWFALLFSTSETEGNTKQIQSLVLNLFATAVMVDAVLPSQVWELLVQSGNQGKALAYSLMFLVLSANPNNHLSTPWFGQDCGFAQFVFSGLLNPRDDKFAFGMLQLCPPTDTDVFRALLSLYRLLDEDTGVHLITEPFNDYLPTLLLVQRTVNEVDWDYSVEWTCAMFAKGLRNANGEVVKFMLSQVLVNYGPVLPTWFVAQHLLPRLQIEELYSPSMFEMTGAFRVQATMVATGRTASKKKYLEANGNMLFNLPDSLFGFFSNQPQASLWSYFHGLVQFKSLSAVCCCVEALTRVLLLQTEQIPHSTFQDFIHLIGFHGTHAGQQMKRGNMITGCLLNLAVVLGNESQALALARLSPDYFLTIESPIRLLTNNVNFLTLYGSTLGKGVDLTLPPYDFALGFAAKFAHAKQQTSVIPFTSERDILGFAFRVLQLVPASSFTSEFTQQLQSLCLGRIAVALQEPTQTLSLLEEAWSESGHSKAKLSTKMDSLAFTALQIATLCQFKHPRLFAAGKAKFMDLGADSLSRLKGLVVCSVLFESQMDNAALAVLLCSLQDRSAFSLKPPPSSEGPITNEPLLWCEFEERKWLVLKQVQANQVVVEPLALAAQLQIGLWEMNSNVVNCLALHCLLQNAEGNFDHDQFADFVQNTDFYHHCTVEMQDIFIAHTDVWLNGPKTLRKLLTHKHLAIGFVKRLALHLFSKVWITGSQALGYESEVFLLLNHVDRVWELQDYSAHEASRSVHVVSNDEQHFICRSTKTIHPASFVAFTCLNWLDLQAKANSEYIQTLAPLLVKELFKQTQFQTKVFSIALLVCSACELDSTLVTSVLQLLGRGGLPPETKENLEMTLVRQIWRNKPQLLGELAELVSSHKFQNNGYLVMSLLSVASIAWRVKSGEKDEVDQIMLQLALPWMGCAKSSIRILATNICLTVSQRGGQISDELKLLLSPMESNGQMVRLMQRVTEDQEMNAKLYLQLDLVTLLETRDFNLFGDLCPRDLKIDKVAEFVRLGQEEFFAEFDPESARGLAEKEEQETEKVENANVALGMMRFQRKIVRPLLLTSVETATRARKRNLIVMATLVDKIPNLAGLARTCEVFSARTLVMEKNPEEIIGLAEFKTISRTAENWLPMISVKRHGMRAYLNQLRLEHGYMIVGLEQTSDSVLLQDFAELWPDHGKVCIVLGAEGTGIPPDVLTCLDRTIEIPQIGHIKSLNVHVSGAMCVWAYTQAMMAKE